MDIIKNWEKKQEVVSFAQNLNECIEWMISITGDVNIDEITKMEEDLFLCRAHHSLGTWIRNTFQLWVNYDRPKRKRDPIVKYFNNLGIYHPDDISGIIITSFHRHLNKKDLKIQEQISSIRKYWDKHRPNINKGIMR